MEKLSWGIMKKKNILYSMLVVEIFILFNRINYRRILDPYSPEKSLSGIQELTINYENINQEDCTSDHKFYILTSKIIGIYMYRIDIRHKGNQTNIIINSIDSHINLLYHVE